MIQALNLLILAPFLPFSRSFTPLRMKIRAHYCSSIGTEWKMAHSDDQEIYEAEELAAYDAHDAPDSGFEAAAMERAVMLADEMKKNHLLKVKSSTNSHVTTNSLHPISKVVSAKAIILEGCLQRLEYRSIFIVLFSSEQWRYC